MTRLARWFFLGTVFLVGACSGKKEAPPSSDKPTPDKPKSDAYERRLGDLLDAAEKGQVSRVEAILKEGANVSDKSADGETALMRAAEKGQTNVAKLLIERSAMSVVDVDNKGHTALMLAAKNGHLPIVNLIEKVFQEKNRGVDLGIVLVKYEALQDRDGRTAVMLAAMNGHSDSVATLLGWMTFDVSEPSLFDKEGRTALMLAATNGHEDVVKLLVIQAELRKQKDYLKAKDKNGKTAFALASKYPKVQSHLPAD